MKIQSALKLFAMAPAKVAAVPASHLANSE
jgi:hypothetical protein